MTSILAIGDSFTFGDELVNRHISAWPVLVGQSLNSTVVNLGVPSSGNTRMVRTAIEQSGRYDLVIVAWSHFARLEFGDTVGTFDIWPGCTSKSVQFENQYGHRRKLLDYISRYYSDKYMYRQYLINVILLQNYFKATGQKYVMLEAFGNNNEGYFKFTNDIQDLVNQIDPTYFMTWPNETMMNWTMGVAKGDKGHFVEDGHRIVADKVVQFIREKEIL